MASVSFGGTYTVTAPATIKINGVDVTIYCRYYEYERVYGDELSEIELSFVRSVLNIVDIENGATIEVWDSRIPASTYKLFWGYIEEYEPNGGLIKVTALDKLWDSVRKEVTKVYDSEIDASAGKISDIFTDLITTYSGLTADSSSVQDSGTTLIIKKFICNHTDPFERCKALAEVLDWQFYYKASTDKVYFEEKGFDLNTNTLEVGINVFNVPKWDYDVTEMINNVTIVGAFQEVETTKSGQIGVTSGFTNNSINLDYEPISVKVFGDAASPPTTLLVGGIEGSTSTFDYSVDKNQNKVLPKSGTTFTTNDYYEIRYSYAAPIPINMYNQTSIDAYGECKKTITLNDIRDIDDAEKRGENLLSRYSLPFISATLRIKNAAQLGLEVGQRIRVVDSVSKPNVDSTLVINKIRIRYPADYDEVDVGDKFWRLSEFNAKVLEKLKRLEERELSNLDIVTNLITIENSVLSPINYIPRYRKVLTQTPVGEGLFIIGSYEYGVIGENALGNGDIGTPANAWVGQYQNSYEEEFVDNDFKDTGSTTATWNTATNELTFTSGQIGQSVAIDYANGTITTATMTVTSSSGSFDLELSADGGANWESVTSGVAHSFANTGTDLRWRITENAASTGTITNIQITSYH